MQAPAIPDIEARDTALVDGVKDIAFGSVNIRLHPLLLTCGKGRNAENSTYY